MASVLFHVPMAQMVGRNPAITGRLALISGLILAAGLVGLAVQILLNGTLHPSFF